MHCRYESETSKLTTIRLPQAARPSYPATGLNASDTIYCTQCVPMSWNNTCQTFKPRVSNMIRLTLLTEKYHRDIKTSAAKIESSSTWDGQLKTSKGHITSKTHYVLSCYKGCWSHLWVDGVNYTCYFAQEFKLRRYPSPTLLLPSHVYII